MTDRASYLERGIKFRSILYYNEIIREIKKKNSHPAALYIIKNGEL
jgi:hypothetical protein